MVPGRRFDGQAWWLRALVRLVLVLAVALPVCAAQAEEEQPDIPPMRFAVVRSSAPGCEPNCPEWISAEGTIEAGTPALFKRALKTLAGRQLPVVVNSPGGNVEAALALGRLIRKNKLDAAVGTTVFTGCEPRMKNCTDKDKDGKAAGYFGMAYDSGAMCNSACPLMFSGGVRRVAGDFAYLGVHQITTTFQRTKLVYRTTYRIVNGKKKIISTRIVSRKNAGSYKTYEMSKGVEKRLAAYLKEMGVDQGVLETMKQTQASDIRQIALDAMLRMKLVTSLDSVDVMTGGAACRPEQPQANCRQVPAGKDTAGVPTAGARPALPQPAAGMPPKEADMRFVLVRGSNPLCNPDCPEWISAEGSITAQAPERLRQALDAAGGRRLPIVISSRGGDVDGALAVGRMIREHKLDVVVARTDFVDCGPSLDCLARDGAHTGLTIDTEGECASVCPIVVAGGIKRLIGPDAGLSVQALGQEEKGKAYLEEMAIGPGLFEAMQRSSGQTQLDRDTALRLGLATGRQSADELTGATICRAAAKPDNCRVMPSANAEAETPAKL
ncbi:MAG: hypothetical protein E5Y06_17920 [Mesorhizobium sp.]|uniref:COG3904 family protein n=1 Tax=Mesorhizobium sp. TaxID=1871066 RepID=UPI00120AEDA6|nr:hypothetical protein [Mesorhizobium sp.]TIN94042.1 MAG: hypothetical protein E5Y06_17920 [Mesorhizobium sp.]TJV01421.1 MAG: hypothetical protein E5Y08_02615 [Mesorhizobium sp.]